MDQVLKDHINMSNKPIVCVMPVDEATAEEREAFRAERARELGHEDFVVMTRAEAATRMRRKSQERALARETCPHGEIRLSCPLCRKDTKLHA